MLNAYKRMSDLTVVSLEEMVNEELYRGNSALLIAAELGFDEMILPLLQAEANVNQSGPEGQTALHFAVSNDRIEVIRLLLAHPTIIVNKSDEYGRTALHIAAEKGLLEIAGLLIEAKALLLRTWC